MGRGEDRHEGAEKVEDRRETGLEPQDQTLDADLRAAHVDFLAKELRPGERPVNNIEIDCRSENHQKYR
jgi:hypothetical protein